MNHPRRIRRLILLAALLGPCVAQAAGRPPALPESEIKAALVLNFARYVEWPAAALGGADAPYVICHMGQERLGAAFAALDGRMLKGRAVRVRVGVDPADARGCHLAFLADTPARGLMPVTRALATQGILTVSDLDGFIDAGGAIGIVPGEDRLQFEVNRDTLDRAGLTASSQLLKLARSLIGKGH